MIPMGGCGRAPVFCLPGGDSPWPGSRSDPAGTPGVRRSPARVTVPSTSPSGPSAGPRRNTTAGTVCTYGPTTCGPPSSCGSPGAGSAPGMAFAPGPPWWTTSRRTGGTGRCSSTRPTIRACASAVTTGRPPGSGRKNAEKETVFKTPEAKKRRNARAPARAPAAPARRRSKPPACRTLPHPRKVLGGGAQDRAAPFV